jgi:hypothetical protein
MPEEILSKRAARVKTRHRLAKFFQVSPEFLIPAALE